MDANVNWSFFEPTKKYVVGCSGGPDSMFLLSMLLKKTNHDNLVVCHVNYHKREDSDYDNQIVENFCSKHNILFYKHDAIKPVHNTENFQSWARAVRYTFFAETANKNNCSGIIVAHHLNDFVETFLMQKERKNTVNYYGIKMQTEYYYNNNAYIIYRPLLNIKKTAILFVNKRDGVLYAVDSSNENTVYLRNRIRKEVDDSKLNQLQQEAKELNDALTTVNLKIRGIIKGDMINLILYNELENNQKARCVYLFLNKYIPDVLHNKSSKIVVEIVKQFNSKRKQQVFIVNKKYKLIKNMNGIYLFLNK